MFQAFATKIILKIQTFTPQQVFILKISFVSKILASQCLQLSETSDEKTLRAGM